MARESLWDPIIPRIEHTDPREWQPFHEDRILVKRLPFPHDLDPAASSLLHIPESSKRDFVKDYQYGEVVSVGPGESWHQLMCDSCNTQRFQPVLAFRGGRDVRTKIGRCDCGEEWALDAIVHFPCSLKPGDCVLYNRNPDYEFEHGGQIYTFMYENQYVLGLVDEAQKAEQVAA